MQPQSRMISLIFHPGITHLQPMKEKRMEQEIGNQVHRGKKVCAMQVCGSPEIGQRPIGWMKWFDRCCTLSRSLRCSDVTTDVVTLGEFAD